ncbi:ImmA/IrrE family metallo-endopeptidase [[Clostridium] innocuum]|uniref:ImmA/IrrE family metallo-endopeptidase n=1 Tax=Clostridium innocuum TaxID=1522 RepID=UPI0011B26169|nr:ImmA/IrrE family metallo-endopeptidase [[Clostridium] innocuum]MCR0316641.1 ImmA/IrrE family metallo-endopeptidase [[Clostridium] innocuum]MCR0371736.1 ImmA/IrrE family metallo-endopeptidase [[Clostridium] innocuum]MCR0376032.1 ImmA/IrrE family metallo-endopeptidase [[Clostridium] innocuum]MCR0561302.1 ImmA/IrrE family metallo-endopeptidase [[Clostridium] innocuum]MCR0604374.1 ImmA/IrrE family metallo-endopeptidase [[Clostridium] innocuum]
MTIYEKNIEDICNIRSNGLYTLRCADNLYEEKECIGQKKMIKQKEKPDNMDYEYIADAIKNLVSRNNLKKYDMITLESIAGLVRSEYSLLENPTPIACILHRAGFKIIKETLQSHIPGIIGISDSLKAVYGCNKILMVNSRLERRKQRFVMAIGLSLYILNYDGHDDYISVCVSYHKSTNEVDDKVILLAEMLLIPLDLIRDKYESMKLLGYSQSNIVTRLSKFFDVDRNIVINRMTGIGIQKI